MRTMTNALRDRWMSGEHVGDKRPFIQVQIQRGLIDRAYMQHEFINVTPGYTERFGYIDGGIHNVRPWQGYWRYTGPWVTLPNVLSCERDWQLEENNGIETATITVENIAFVEQDGPGGSYHVIDPGHYSPWRGWQGFGRPQSGEINEWFDLLNGGFRVRVWEGYGTDSDYRIKTFDGIIDSTDAGAKPSQIVLTCRNFGAMLSDQRVFGWNKARDIRSPVVFADATSEAFKNAKKEARTKHWIIVRDPADVVRWVLMWAGFKEWDVENVGAPLKEPITFHQSDYFIDIINRIKSQGNFVFYVEPSASADELAIGKPIFRYSTSTIQQSVVEEVTDQDLLTDVKTQFTKENLPFTITTRGRSTTSRKVGSTWGEDTTLHVQALYFPPWSGSHYDVITGAGNLNIPDIPANYVMAGRNAGLWRHVVRSDKLLETAQLCQMANVLVALQEALSAFTATIEIPANPGLQVNDQISVVDNKTGTNMRLWILHIATSHRTGREVEFKQTITGALLDFPDVQIIVNDYYALLNAVVAQGGVVI